MNLHALYKKLGPLLRPFSFPYALLMAKRREFHRRGLFSIEAPRCPCVSVGNIAWGGSGKTPLTAWLLQWAKQRDLRAAVLTRGYGGNPGTKPLLVRADSGPEQAGDEPLMLAQTFPEAAVLAFPKRVESARFACGHLNPDIFILDDGMQHLAMGRHVEIVLLRPEDLETEWNRVIPSGSWRESASALAAASVFAIKADAEEFARLKPTAETRLSAFGKGLYSFTLAPVGLRPLALTPGNTAGRDSTANSETRAPAPEAAHGAGNEPHRAHPLPPLLEPGEYHNRPYILVSGVGNPAQVEESVRQLMGRPPVQHFAFADHHPYSGADIQAVCKLSPAPLPVICTAKDAVKIRKFTELLSNTPAWVLETELRFGPSLFTDLTFPQWWNSWWDTRHTSLNTLETTHQAGNL